MSSSEAASNVVSFPLALSVTNQSLHCSLHKVSNPCALAQKLKDSSKSSVHGLALMDARRLVSINQLICAANQAAHRASPTRDALFLSAVSSHMGHVMRDTAFLGENAQEEEEAMVLVFQIASGDDAEYLKLLEQNGLFDSIQPDMDDYFAKQRETSKAQFQQWYKLTDQEMVFSLESSVLTKVATKMV